MGFDMNKATAICYNHITGEEDPRVVQILDDCTIGFSSSPDVKLEIRDTHTDSSSCSVVPINGYLLKRTLNLDGTQKDVSPHHLYPVSSLLAGDDRSDIGRSNCYRFLSDFINDMSGSSNTNQWRLDFDAFSNDVRSIIVGFNRDNREWKLTAKINSASGEVVVASGSQPFGKNGVIDTFIKKLAKINELVRSN